MGIRRSRRVLAALTAVATGVASAAVLLVAAEPAAAASPTRILNTGSGAGLPNWLESQSVPDDQGDDENGRFITVTFLAEHLVGRRITQVQVGTLGNGTQTFNVTPQAYPTSSSNGMETSRVTLTYDPGKAGGFSCPLVGGATRRRGGLTQTFRVIDNAGEQSAQVSFNNFFQVENGDCLGRTDFADIYGQSQSATAVAPNQNVTFTFAGDDADNTGTNDFFDQYRWRLRRLNDGFTTGLTNVNPGGGDNTVHNLTVSFPSRGRWVVEAEPGGEDGYGESGSFFRLGAVDVNEAAAPSASIGFSATPSGALFNSTPPSVNAGTPVNAVLTAGDSGGAVQVAEWDATNDGTFERFEYTVPSSGTISHPGLTTTELTQSIATASFGTRSVRARATDNGAIDGSDNIRRQTTTSAELRVNAIPTANSQTVNTTEDNAIGFTLMGNDADNQPRALTYELVSTPPGSAGTLNCSTIPACTFTPAANFNGSTNFQFRVADGPVSSGANAGQAWSSSASATVTINVAAVNDAPTATGQSVSTPEDTNKLITLAGTDVEPGTLTFGIVSPPTHGTLSGTGANRTYDPDDNFHGADSFVFSVTDAGGLSGTATVSIMVTAVNDAPIAADQTLNTDEDQNLSFSLAASDVDGDTVSFVAPTSGPTNGSVTCLGAACTYDPDDDFNGTDSFTFTANDGTGNTNSTDSGTITINVAPVNDAPEAAAQSVTLDEDTPMDVALGATDVDGDTLTYSVTTPPANGSATAPVGNVTTYTPDAHYFGGDQFEFTATDPGTLADTAIVVLTINPVNDAPTIEPQAFSTDEDTPVVLSVVAFDVDGDALDWSVGSGPANGQLVGALPDIGYLPDGNFHGTDSFVVQVDDGNGGVSTATVTITVAPVNDAPVASPVTVSTSEDQAVLVALAGADVDGDIIGFTVTDPSDHGTLDCVIDVCTYTPDAEFHGSDLAIFEVSDGTETDTASVSITVTPVNDPPVAAIIPVTTDEDVPVGITLSATDVDGDPLTFAVVSPPINGSLEGTPPSIVYTPNPHFFGADTIDYSVSDGSAEVGGVVVISVAPVNDAPVAHDVTATVGEDTTVDFTLSAVDVDSGTLTFTVDTPSDGSVSCVADACTYTTAPNFTGVVTFGYQASDGELSDGALVTIDVNGENDQPEASPSTASTDEDTPAGITLSATDVDGDELTYHVLSGPDHGTLDGTGAELVYTPAVNFNGTDAFTWSASDGSLASVPVTVTITVRPVNDAAVALPRVVDTEEDTAVSFSLLAEDPEGNPLTFTAGSASNGVVSCSAAGACSYTPAANFHGIDSFGFEVTDSAGAGSSATVTITVAPAALLETRIVAEPVLLTLGPVFRARLTTAAGAPVAGRVLRFSAGGLFRCQATTDANGNASCGAPLLDLPAVLNLGYDVTFAGDFDHAASTGRGTLLRLVIRLF